MAVYVYLHKLIHYLNTRVLDNIFMAVYHLVYMSDTTNEFHFHFQFSEFKYHYPVNTRY